MAKTYAVSIKLDDRGMAKLTRLMEASGRTASGIFRHMLDRVELQSDVRVIDEPLNEGVNQ